MTRNIDSIRRQEKQLREKLLLKTYDLLDKLLADVPTRSLLFIGEMPIKVICGADGKKSLLINDRPLSSATDCEWVIENFNQIKQAVDELVNPEAEEILKVIEKTEYLIQRVDELTQSHL
ncbi:MAG: hypothetical protein GX922_00960 [Firmicutes bacterium]|nr:hypothetical protein [Bacillota bacterium]